VEKRPADDHVQGRPEDISYLLPGMPETVAHHWSASQRPASCPCMYMTRGIRSRTRSEVPATCCFRTPAPASGDRVKRTAGRTPVSGMKVSGRRKRPPSNAARVKPSPFRLDLASSDEAQGGVSLAACRSRCLGRHRGARRRRDRERREQDLRMASASRRDQAAAGDRGHRRSAD
jgi:hypothetical protein